MKRIHRLVLFGVGVATICCPATGQAQDAGIDLFLRAVQADDTAAGAALDALEREWSDDYPAMLVELAGFVSPPVRDRVLGFLEERTGQLLGSDMNRWRQWVWSNPHTAHPGYIDLKRLLFSRIDPLMAEFLRPDSPRTIRLDEVQWGGVRVNGIPPLDHPVHIPASDAGYLNDTDIVFGIAINVEAKAYPKRILAWHEMALDLVGGVELTIIYCTLCGTVLPYESEAGGRLHRFGTSGLLYRSNKLFFDHGTASLWSTLVGRPVIGPLVGRADLELALRSSVTTTWGEWLARHPDTVVLSLETGYNRDYSEGAAYADYFSTDELMFDVPLKDDRLRNKDEVLVMRIEPSTGGEWEPWAIAADFLNDNPVYRFTARDRSFTVVTSEAGANRVYETGDVTLDAGNDAGSLVDEAGGLWRLDEDALVAVDDDTRRLPRFTANRAFWFGWYAQFPETELIDR